MLLLRLLFNDLFPSLDNAGTGEGLSDELSLVVEKVAWGIP